MKGDKAMKTQKSNAMKMIREMEREYECYKMRAECLFNLLMKLTEQSKHDKADLCKQLYNGARSLESFESGVLTGYKTMLRLMK